jgi:hypothetical protein
LLGKTPVDPSTKNLLYIKNILENIEIMPVTATSNPDVIRVSFKTMSAALNEVEAVVFARAMDDGRVELHYSHQVFRERPIEDGPWDERETIQRTPLTPALSEQIRVGAMLEIFSRFFCAGLQTLRIPPGSDPTAFQWVKPVVNVNRPS